MLYFVTWVWCKPILCTVRIRTFGAPGQGQTLDLYLRPDYWSQTSAYPEVANRHVITTSLNCKSCSSIYVPGIGQTVMSWSRPIDEYSRWQSSMRTSFWVVHLSLIKSFRWSPSLPFALSSQRQKVVKLFSSRSEHTSRSPASLGWSEGLQHYRTIPVSPTVGTQDGGYLRKVPLPCIPLQQSTALTAGATPLVNPRTCYLQVPRIPTWSDLTRSHLNALRSSILPVAPCWLM